MRENAIHKSLDLEEPKSNQWLYDFSFAREPGIPGHKVHITTLLYQVAFFKDKRAYGELVKYASAGYDFLTRINAIQALEPINLLTPEYNAYLFDALFDPNWKLRKEARRVLQDFNQDEEARKLLQEYVKTERKKWNDFQKRSVKRTFEANPL
ncbi:MAG: HEAT repeat domain-containing protein [Owenweeksia sp.]|nr:HEAT repeat domain-containing protein [Owenweeksia sp.]